MDKTCFGYHFVFIPLISFIFILFSRVLRDSMNRYDCRLVCRSVGRSVGWSVRPRKLFLAFLGVFRITAPAFSCFVFWSLGLLVF